MSSVTRMKTVLAQALNVSGETVRATVRNRCLALLLVLPALASPQRAASGQAARVLVNQRELRVEFPDTAQRRGWPSATGQSGERFYMWRIEVDAPDGPRTFSLDVAPDSGVATRDFASLEALVAAGRLLLCWNTPRGGCSSRSTASAFVDSGRVVLRLSDPRAIAQLFGLRPTTVRVQQQTPSDLAPAPWLTVAVTYTSPQIPPPNAALVAGAARAGSRYGPPQWAWRALQGGPRRGDTLSLTVGDTATLHIQEATCHYDLCITMIDAPPDGSWTVDDTSVVTLALTDSAPLAVDARATKGVVTARRAGHTTLRVKLSVPVRENIGDANPANTTIELPVVVVP